MGRREGVEATGNCQCKSDRNDFEKPPRGSAVIGTYRGVRYSAVIETMELSEQKDERNSQVWKICISRATRT